VCRLAWTTAMSGLTSSSPAAIASRCRSPQAGVRDHRCSCHSASTAIATAAPVVTASGIARVNGESIAAGNISSPRNAKLTDEVRLTTVQGAAGVIDGVLSVVVVRDAGPTASAMT
jgi:hypothetical protein